MIKDWVRHHQLVSFIILAYAMNFAFALIILAIPGLVQFTPVWLIPGATPTLSAIIVCAVTGGRVEVRRLLSGWFCFKLGWRWYLAALAFVLGPLLFALVYIALGHAPRGLAPGTTLFTLVGGLLMTCLGAPVGEEAGWRGFALPRLQQKYNALLSSVLLGLIWAFWHIPFYIDPEMAADHIPFGIFILICIVLSILFTWIFNNTRGSLVGPMLAHFCFNFTGSFIAGRLGLVPPMVIYIAGGVMLTGWAILVVAMARPAYFSNRPVEALPFQRYDENISLAANRRFAMQLEKPSSQRRFDLDWLRVYAILAVFVFHSSRFFDTRDWHVKNPATYFEADVWVTFMASWLMPFIFMISSASLYYALGLRGAKKFIDDKLKRLLLPLIVGIFTHVMFQVYLERITHAQFSGTFFEFIPVYFEGWYGFGGNFAWMGLHLWYLLILFVFSVLFYPLFRWLSAGAGKQLLNRIGAFLALPGMIYTLGLPVAALFVVLDPHEVIGMRAFGGWPLWVYMLFFVNGFIVMAHEGLQKCIQQVRWISLAAAVMCTIALLAMWAGKGDPAFGSSRYAQIFGIFGMSSWCWLLAFFGFGMKHLNYQTKFLSYANEAVLPFYILHQTVLLCSGYFITRWDIPDPAKFILIGSSSFLVIMAVYEVLVRRVIILRVLFGMKPNTKLQVVGQDVRGRIDAKA